jgi:hypothetical protein
MAQTTAGMSGKDLKIEFSTNGSTWTDISGFANKVEPDDAERVTGETNTFDGDTAIVRGGKRKGQKVKVSIVYTEGVSDAWNTIKAQFDSGGDAYIRYAPRGGQTGEKQFTSDAGIISKMTYPKADAGSGDVLMAGFELHTPKLTESTAA